MAKKVFTDESLKAFVDEIKSYTDNATSKKANTSHTHKVANISDLTATATELNYMDGVTSNVQEQLDTLTSALDKKAKRISLNGQCQLTSYRTSVIALCKAPTDAYCGGANSSYSSGQLSFHRTNGLYPPVIAIVSMGAAYGATNRVRARYLCSSGFSIFKPCTFTYDGITYGGLEVKTSDAEAYNVSFIGETTFDIFALDIYDSNKQVALNEEVYNSISYDNAIIESGWKDSGYSIINSSTIGSQSVASAKKDGSGNIISSTYETKTDASNKLSTAKAYADTVANNVKNELLNGAGTAYDTLKELGDLITDNQEAIDVLEDVAAGKANAVHTHVVSDVTNLQITLDAKQAAITGGASTITSSNLTANRALVSNGSGKVAVSAVTSTELGYLDGVTSNLQTQLDAKASSSHTHSYAGSSSVGGAATSANKLNTDAGSATQPVYFSNGVPVATTYTLGKSVPSDAKFSDTTYSVATTSANGLMSSTDKKRVDSMSGSYSLGSFASKTVADLQAALDTWLDSYVNIANSSAKFQASQDWVAAWNSGNTATTISAGGTWTVTNIAPYSTKAYAQLRISYYSDEWVVYVHRSSGTWGAAHQAAFKDDLTSKQDTVTGGASTITASNLTANRALISNSSGKVAVSAVTNTELGYLDGVTQNIQEQLDGKASSTHNHSTSNITSGTLSSDRLPTVPIAKGGTGATTAAAALTNLGITATAAELNKLDGVTATTAEINYIDGVTSNIQTQLDGKSNISHTHSYAGSSSVGGAATSANKLATARTISLTGDVTGSTSFDGSGNVSITATITDDSHNHVISNVDGLQTALDAKLSTSGGTVGALIGSSTITANGALSGNSNTKTPFTTTTDLYYINKKLTWNSSSYIQHVILLLPVLTATNWFGYNYIDGEFLCWKNGGNVYDKVEINANCVYNSLRYHLEYFGDNPSWELCICKYNGVSYYALNCPYHANPYTNVEFVGHIRSDLTGGTSTVALPLDVPYYDENTSTVLNEEVRNSITATLTTSVVTSASGTPLYSKNGFAGSLSGNATTATTATKLGSSTIGSATQPIYLNGGTATACTYTLGKSVPSNAVFTDTNTKVTNTLATTTKAYVTGTTSATTNTGTQVFDTGVYLDTTAGQLTATIFNGTTFSGGGVATLAEVQSYLGI